MHILTQIARFKNTVFAKINRIFIKNYEYQNCPLQIDLILVLNTFFDIKKLAILKI